MSAVMTNERFAAIKARCEKATAGPWYAFHQDDDVFMNAYGVTTNESGPSSVENGYKEIVALTLYQSKRVVCHELRKWHEDSDFIAHARTDVPDLVAEVERLRKVEAAAREYVDVVIEHDGSLVWSEKNDALHAALDAAKGTT